MQVSQCCVLIIKEFRPLGWIFRTETCFQWFLTFSSVNPKKWSLLKFSDCELIHFPRQGLCVIFGCDLLIFSYFNQHSKVILLENEINLNQSNLGFICVMIVLIRDAFSYFLYFYLSRHTIQNLIIITIFCATIE